LGFKSGEVMDVSALKHFPRHATLKQLELCGKLGSCWRLFVRASADEACRQRLSTVKELELVGVFGAHVLKQRLHVTQCIQFTPCLEPSAWQATPTKAKQLHEGGCMSLGAFISLLCPRLELLELNTSPLEAAWVLRSLTASERGPYEFKFHNCAPGGEHMQEMLAQVARFKALRHFSLDYVEGCEMQSSVGVDVSQLAHLRSLTVLNLVAGGTVVGLQTVLSSCTALREVGLRAAKISELAPLHSSSLEVVDLSWMPLLWSLPGFAVPHGLPRLKKVTVPSHLALTTQPEHLHGFVLALASLPIEAWRMT
jgi:hypothetical protein